MVFCCFVDCGFFQSNFQSIVKTQKLVAVVDLLVESIFCGTSSLTVFPGRDRKCRFIA